MRGSHSAIRPDTMAVLSNANWSGGGAGSGANAAGVKSVDTTDTVATAGAGTVQTMRPGNSAASAGSRISAPNAAVQTRWRALADLRKLASHATVRISADAASISPANSSTRNVRKSLIVPPAWLCRSGA